MGTIINGKIYRNVPEKAEGIETESLKVTGESTVEMSSIKTEEIETKMISGSAIGGGVNDISISSDSGQAADITLSNEQDKGIITIAAADENGDRVGKIEVSNYGVIINGDADETGSGELQLIGPWSSEIKFEKIHGMIQIQANGIEINPDYEGNDTTVNIAEGILQVGYNGIESTLDSGEGVYLKLSGLPTSDPQVAGAVWNDNGVLKISSGQ